MSTLIKLPGKTVLIICAALVIAGCAGKGGTGAKTANQPAGPFDSGSTLYTLTNLHPDPVKHQLYSSNFQLPGGLIPRCTAVKAVSISKKRFEFSVKDVVYRYDFNPRSNPEGLDANLKQYFGKSCSNTAVTSLSATDQKGIREGKAYVGMSKQGLIYAMGYPPVSPTTPDIKAPVWKYFINRFNTMNVEFKGNTVSKIVN
jgi:hypothetical protein